MALSKEQIENNETPLLFDYNNMIFEAFINKIMALTIYSKQYEDLKNK